MKYELVDKAVKNLSILLAVFFLIKLVSNLGAECLIEDTANSINSQVTEDIDLNLDLIDNFDNLDYEYNINLRCQNISYLRNYEEKESIEIKDFKEDYSVKNEEAKEELVSLDNSKEDNNDSVIELEKSSESTIEEEPLINNKGEITNEEITKGDIFTVVYSDVRIPSGLTSEELETCLIKNFKGLSSVFIEAEKRYNINALILVSISAMESGWGTVCFEPYNIFGFYTNENFSSYEECIFYVAEFLQTHYLNEESIYFNGYSLSDINTYYNGNYVWEDKIGKLAIQLYQEINNS